MSHLSCSFLLAATLGLLASNVGAQTTYKCGSGYSQTPCADGKVIAIDDARTEEQRRQADANTVRSQQAASALEKERIAQEKKDALALKKANADSATAKPKSAPTKVYKQRPVKPPKAIKVLKKKKATVNKR